MCVCERPTVGDREGETLREKIERGRDPERKNRERKRQRVREIKRKREREGGREKERPFHPVERVPSLSFSPSHLGAAVHESARGLTHSPPPASRSRTAPVLQSISVPVAEWRLAGGVAPDGGVPSCAAESVFSPSPGSTAGVRLAV